MNSEKSATVDKPEGKAGLRSKDGLGDNSGEKLKRSDQIRLLQLVLKHEETGKWDGLFTYPNCGFDLVQMGLATQDGNLTVPGRAALWLLGHAADPTASKAVETFKMPLSPND